MLVMSQPENSKVSSQNSKKVAICPFGGETKNLETLEGNEEVKEIISKGVSKEISVNEGNGIHNEASTGMTAEEEINQILPKPIVSATSEIPYSEKEQISEIPKANPVIEQVTPDFPIDNIEMFNFSKKPIISQLSKAKEVSVTPKSTGIDIEEEDSNQIWMTKAYKKRRLEDSTPFPSKKKLEPTNGSQERPFLVAEEEISFANYIHPTKKNFGNGEKDSFENMVNYFNKR